MTSLEKIGLILGVVAIIALTALGGFLFYNSQKNQIANAYGKGVADAQNATLVASNKQMVDAMQNIVKLTEATNSQMANIRVTAQVEQNKIDSFKVDSTHPEEVEKWANQTTTQLFSNIQTDSAETAK